MTSFNPRRLRAMAHLDVDDMGVERAAATFAEVVEAQIGAKLQS